MFEGAPICSVPWSFLFAFPLPPKGGRGALVDSFGSLDEHRQLAERHLMSSHITRVSHVLWLKAL